MVLPFVVRVRMMTPLSSFGGGVEYGRCSEGDVVVIAYLD
jgi:hypothetical protein